MISRQSVKEKLQIAINWEVVRKVGEIKMLTKVSYIALILVPIVAGSWPFIENIINGSNTLIGNINGMREQLADIAKEAGQLNVNLGVESLQKQIESLQEDIKSLPEKKMSRTWALSFFAALLIVIGHLLYEVFCPKIIQDYSDEEFKRYKAKEYSAAPNPIELQLAKNKLDNKIGRKIFDQRESKKDVTKFVKGLLEKGVAEQKKLLGKKSNKLFYDTYFRMEDDKAFAKEYTALALLIKNEEKNKDQNVRDRYNNGYQISQISAAAEVDYLNTSVERWLMASLPILFYCIGFYLILCVILIQSSIILEMTMGENLNIKFFTPFDLTVK